MKLYTDEDIRGAGDRSHVGGFMRMPGTKMWRRVEDYRVLKAHGPWRVGDLIEAQWVDSVTTIQNLRAKVWEIAVVYPYLRGGPDDPEVAHLWAAKEKKPRKKAEPAAEPDDGPADL